MGIPLLQGRDFSPEELQPLIGLPGQPGTTASAAPVAVINHAMARYFFGEKDPVGQRFHFREGPYKDIPIEIIGLAKDAKYEDLREPTRRIFYLSYFQWPHEGSQAVETRLLLRSIGDLSSAAAAIQRAVRELDPQLQVLELQTMNDVVNETLTQERFIAQLGSCFSLAALFLASIGLYGVMSYATSRRTQEIGIRIALGAQSLDVVRLVLQETLWLVIIGVTIGLTAALAATRVITSLLFGLAATDPLTIAISVFVMLSTALLACWIPARRAMRVDPLVALRSE